MAQNWWESSPIAEDNKWWASSPLANDKKPEPGLIDRAKQGFSSTVTAGKIFGTDDPEEIARLVAEEQRTKLPATPVQRKMAEEIQPYAEAYNKSEGLDAVGKFASLAAKRLSQFVSNPKELAGSLIENLPNSAPGIAGGIAGAAGGAATPVPFGTVIGGVAGGTAGGYLVEQGGAMRDQILKEAQTRNIDPSDPKALEPLIREKYDEFLSKSRLKGIGTAGTDAVLNVLTVGLAGAGERALVREGKAITEGVARGAVSAEQAAARVAGLEAANAARNTLGAKTLRGAGIMAGEGAGEGLSEAAGQKLAYGQVDALDVVDEAIMGVGTGAGISAGRGLISKAIGQPTGGSIEESIKRAQVAAGLAQEREAGATTDAQLDRSLDQLERARDAVYLGGQPGAETVANIVGAPDLNSAIDAAEASVPSMQQLMEEKRQTAANAARMALGETVASPSFDVNQAVADANARREAAIAGVQADLGLPQVTPIDRRSADQIMADFEAGRTTPQPQAEAAVPADPAQQLESVKAALRNRELMSVALPEDRQQLLSIATTLTNPKLPEATRADLAQQAFTIIGQYQASMQQDPQYLSNTAAAGPAVLNGVPDTNILPAARPPATPQAPLEFTPTDTLQAGTELGAAPANQVETIEPTGLVRALDEPAPTGGRRSQTDTQIPAVPGLPGVADTLNVNLAGQTGATDQQNATLLGEPRDPGTELAKQRVAAGYQAPPAAPRPQKVNGTPTAQLTNEQLNQIAADEKLPAIARRGAQIELGYRRSEVQPQAAQTTPTSPDVPPTGATPSEMYRKTMRYASGLSAVGDLGNGSIASGGLETRGVGVDVGELSKNAITTIGNAVANLRTALFVDSGAFGAFRRGLKSGQFAPMDFDAILSKYDDILDAIDEANPAEETDYPRPRLVMPDVVGNQAASLELLNKYKTWISAEANGNRAQLIIPIQKGKMSMADAYRAAVNTLGTDNFIVGIPSNEAAVSPQELTEFLRDARPKAIHVLGAASEKNLTPRLQSVIDSGLAGQIEVTADASPIRSAVLNAVAKGAKRGDAIKEFLFDQQDPALARDNQQSGIKTSEQRVAPEATNVALEATQQGMPVSTLGNITTVDPATLQTNSKASSGTISKQTHRMISLIGSMFGKKVVLFSSDNEMAPDGFVRTGDSRTIHLNVKSQVSHLVVFGHELLHQLKADNPQAYAALMKVIKLKEGADTNVAGIRGDMEELTADVVGNRFRETEFWRDVFREILASGTDATVSQRSAMRLGASVVRAVDRMVKALKGMTGFDTDNMVENLAEVKSAVTKALASYAQEKRGEATELIREQAAGRQGPAADTTGEIKTSLRRADFTNPEDRLEVSTTRPVPAPKKGRTSNSYDEKWVIDGQDVRASKNHVNAIVRALREYNTLSGKGNASKLMQELHDVVVENLLWLHDLVPENVRARAKLWYDGANRIATDWTSKYGVSLRQSSGVLAVLSPQMDWFKNVSLGERVISIWKNRQNETWSPAMTAWLQSWVNASKDVNTKASRQAILDEARPLQGVTLSNMNDRQAALYIRVFDETYHERQYRLVTPEGGFGDYVSNSDDGEASVTWGGFDTIEKAVSILNDGSFRNIDEKLGDEHKVRNFYNNIISPGSADGHVTIDTHAVAAALVKALSGSAREVADNFGSAGQNAETGASGTYGLFADAYRAAAEQRGILPREMQSITWEAVRALFPASIKDQLAPQVDAVWDRFKNGELTRDQAREEVRKLAGGVRKMAWEGSDAGKAAADGGTSFNSEISENVAGRQARTLPPEVAKDKVQVNLSANTSSIPGVAALQAAAAGGDMLAHRLLQDIALDNLRHLLSSTSARVKADGVTGLYGGYVESGLSMTVTFADEDRAAVLAALAKFADNFNQEQVHVRRGVKAKAGTTFGDGSYATPVYRWELKKPLSRKKIEDVIAQSGLYGLTFGDDFVEAYYVGDPSDEAAITGFEQAIDRAGRLVGRAAESAGRTVERLWAYGDSARGLGYERIQGDVPAGTGLSSETAKRVAGYLNAVKDKDGKPALGKTKTFDNAEITPKQQALQEQIARAYDRLPDNDLKNRNVRKAYTELSKELLRQYQALPIKVEVFTGEGEPYASSAAMRRDVLDNNHLFILATEPGKFGPEGQDFSSHPLLGQTGETDSKGRPMLYNDLLRAVHDYFAHSMSPVSFGPKGEEAAWKNHMAMTNNMWARWALTMETRAQNSWVNFREGLDPTLPLGQRGFAPQKAALLPVQYTLTGDRIVDKPMKEFIAGLNDKVKQGSKPVSGVKASEKRAEDLTPDDLSGRKIRVPVRVEETGETATLTMDAGLALNDINEREAAMQRLLACVSK